MWRTITRFVYGEGDTSHWVKDTDAETCQRCDRVFTLSRRRHHCRGCGKLVCIRCWHEARGYRCCLCLTAEDVLLWGPCKTATEKQGFNCQPAAATDADGVPRVYTTSHTSIPIGSWILSCNNFVVKTPADLTTYLKEEPFSTIQYLDRLLEGYVVEIYSQPEISLTMTMTRDRISGLPVWRAGCGATMRQSNGVWLIGEYLRSAVKCFGRLPQDVSCWEFRSAATKRWVQTSASLTPFEGSLRSGSKIAILTSASPHRTWLPGTVNAVLHTGQVSVRYDRKTKNDELIDQNSGRICPEPPQEERESLVEAVDAGIALQKEKKKEKKKERKQAKKERKQRKQAEKEERRKQGEAEEERREDGAQTPSAASPQSPSENGSSSDEGSNDELLHVTTTRARPPPGRRPSQFFSSG
eukprot:TRINITY_DN3931_c5_g1_i1.p1 TRINITY_DN3931_c5_g1~~TRINITY_DN3931_c5_g1_i1.p1  ORF type:complete len:412 (+),score=40.32 TRINITY_DN3931_c5_g1_i1:56-1291(+)